MPGPMQARAREAMRAARTVLLQLVHLPQRAKRLLLSFSLLCVTFFTGVSIPPFSNLPPEISEQRGGRTADRVSCHGGTFLRRTT